MTVFRHWLLQTAIALDQLVNALLGGWADETLSSRAWRMETKGRPWGRMARLLIDTLLWFDPQLRPSDTPESLWRDTLAPMGLRLIADVLSALDAGQVPRRPQPPDLGTWEPAFKPQKLADR